MDVITVSVGCCRSKDIHHVKQFTAWHKCFIFDCCYHDHWGSLVAQTVKNLSAMQESWVLFLGQEDPLEKEMATHSSILAWRIPWTEEAGGCKTVHGDENSQT